MRRPSPHGPGRSARIPDPADDGWCPGGPAHGNRKRGRASARRTRDLQKHRFAELHGQVEILLARQSVSRPLVQIAHIDPACKPKSRSRQRRFHCGSRTCNQRVRTSLGPRSWTHFRAAPRVSSSCSRASSSESQELGSFDPDLREAGDPSSAYSTL